MPDILFPELHPSVVEEWKKRQGAQRGYMGKTKQPKAVQPKTTVTKPRTDVRQRQYDPKTNKLVQGPVSTQQFKGTYEDYLNWYNTQSVMAPTETEIEKFESLYDKYKVGMIIEKVPQHLKQIIPMEWWKKFEIQLAETGSSELEDAINIMEWGLAQGDRNQWTKGMTEIAYAAQFGYVTPEEIYYTGLSGGDKAPPHIKDIIEKRKEFVFPTTDEGWAKLIATEQYTSAEVNTMRDIMEGEKGDEQAIRDFYAEGKRKGYDDTEIYQQATVWLKTKLDITTQEAQKKIDKVLNEILLME